MKLSPYLLIALLCAAPGLLAAQDQLPAKPAAQPAAAPAPAQPTPEQAELTKLTTENQLADQRLKKKLQPANAEKEELKAQYELDQQKQRAKTAALEAELALAVSENKLAEEKNKKAMADLALKMAKLKADNDLKAEAQRSDALTDGKERNEIDLKMKRLDLAERQLKFEKAELDNRIAKLNSDLELRGKKEEWKKQTNTEPVYTSKPYSDGKLVISDRRISLNGPIFTGVADYVTERIHYYNNISTQPVFIVIDMCPGGSVMEGYRIVKAMQASKAPVHVVVKSYAASMAAVIATLADRSYVYPNAIILHHQMSSFAWGNMTQMKEQLELNKEWERRLHVPVSKKMGISIEEFRKKMYEKNSDGDWEEFGDKAVAYKWVTDVVEEIDETGIIKNPDEKQTAKPTARFSYSAPLDEKVDEKGQRFVTLPRLEPFDFYFIYNPDRYYR
jgi:ATP-dependent Clp protease protease subunit